MRPGSHSAPLPLRRRGLSAGFLPYGGPGPGKLDPGTGPQRARGQAPSRAKTQGRSRRSPPLHVPTQPCFHLHGDREWPQLLRHLRSRSQTPKPLPVPQSCLFASNTRWPNREVRPAPPTGGSKARNPRPARSSPPRARSWACVCTPVKLSAAASCTGAAGGRRVRSYLFIFFFISVFLLPRLPKLRDSERAPGAHQTPELHSPGVCTAEASRVRPRSCGF